MRLSSVPPFVKDRRIEIERVSRRYAAAAIEAEREAERLRLLANNSHAPTEEHRQANERFPPALQHAKEVRALASAEQKVFDAIERLIQSDTIEFESEPVAVDTAGYDWATVNARLAEIDRELHELTTAFTPHSRAEIELYVSLLGRAFERGIKFQGDKMIFPVDVFNETEPDWWKKDCSMQPQVAVEWRLRIEQERAAHPYPPGERPAALVRLNAEKLKLQYIAAKLVDQIRDGDRGQQVMRDASFPPQCVLGAGIKLPTRAQAAA
jgi:hypothetical protein